MMNFQNLQIKNTIDFGQTPEIWWVVGRILQNNSLNKVIFSKFVGLSFAIEIMYKSSSIYL